MQARWHTLPHTNSVMQTLLKTPKAFGPRAPSHWLFSPGIFMVTAATYDKEPVFHSSDRLTMVMDRLLTTALEFAWDMKAWAILPNHYHFIAESHDEHGESLKDWLWEFHRTTAARINAMSREPERRIWMSYRESRIMHPHAYMVRLHWVMRNPVHHGLAQSLEAYSWSSARWFLKNAPPYLVDKVTHCKTDKLRIWDDF